AAPRAGRLGARTAAGRDGGGLPGARPRCADRGAARVRRRATLRARGSRRHRDREGDGEPSGSPARRGQGPGRRVRGGRHERRRRARLDRAPARHRRVCARAVRPHVLRRRGAGARGVREALRAGGEGGRPDARAVRPGGRRVAAALLRTHLRRAGGALAEGPAPEGAHLDLPAAGRSALRPQDDPAGGAPDAGPDARAVRARFLLPLALAARALAVAPPAPVAAPAAPSIVDRDVRVPARDGVRLRADVLRPGAEGRFPTLVYRTPYDRERAEENDVVRAALAHGYAVVLEDVRGRYGSEGVFTPYVHEGHD